MLRISRTATPDDVETVLRLEGQVAGRLVEELRRACADTVDTNGQGRHHLVLDLAEVSFADADGVALFRELIARRVLLTNRTPFMAEQLKGVANVDD